VTQNFADI